MSATDAQVDYVRALQKRLHLPGALLDSHCVSTFGVPFTDINMRQCSVLIHEMKNWDALPAELMRMKGQQDLPGMEATP